MTWAGNRIGGDAVSRTFEIMQACLLSDFGEILCRAGVGEGPRARRAAAYFRDKLSKDVAGAIEGQGDAGAPLDAPAGIVRASKRIALGAAQAEACPPGAALESIFNRLNGRRGNARFAADWSEAGIQYPSADARNSADAYRRALARWEAGAGPELYTAPCANALLALMERCFAYVPAAECVDGRMDVSLVHQCRATAAIGCCLERWLHSRRVDPRAALSPDAKPFLLCTLDLSGIQSFIYTISSKGALKGLRARSFYLSMLMEHIADTILEACGLWRVNLIYAGGGRAQLLLPNDEACASKVRETVEQVNAFLLDRFDAALYLAWGCAEASAAALSSSGADGKAFSDIFREASRQISERKLRRYSAKEWMALNRKDERRASERECVVCGRSSRLEPHGDGDMICDICGALERFSNVLTADDLLLNVQTVPQRDALPLPGGLWLARDGGETAPLRTYCVNAPFAPRPNAIWLNTGNARACNGDGTAMTFEALAGASAGVERLGVFRADVDNLGALFASGFRDPNDPKSHRFETLPRYMALSAAMTAFFQREINGLVRRGGDSWLPDAAAQAQRRVTIVYSGGDDVFLVGAWNEALDAGLALQRAFCRYTGGGVTLSGGLGLFTDHEPVGIMADVAAGLEEEAKLIADGTKDAVALFAPADDQRNQTSFVFHWDDLRKDVLGEKLDLLHRAFTDSGRDEQAAGNAFLYQVLGLLRKIEPNAIEVARLAYLLARHAPREANPDYDAFMHSVYRWALEPEQNRALQAAILLHVYAHRGEGESDG